MGTEYLHPSVYLIIIIIIIIVTIYICISPSGLLVVLGTMLGELVPKFIEMTRTDKDRSIAMTALHCMQEMLDNIGGPVLQISEDCLQVITAVAKEVLSGKVNDTLPHPPICAILVWSPALTFQTRTAGFTRADTSVHGMQFIGQSTGLFRTAVGPLYATLFLGWLTHCFNRMTLCGLDSHRDMDHRFIWRHPPF